jgi:hypothetical protein
MRVGQTEGSATSSIRQHERPRLVSFLGNSNGPAGRIDRRAEKGEVRFSGGEVALNDSRGICIGNNPALS